MFHRALASLYTIATLQFLPNPWRIVCFAALGVAAGLALTVGKVSRATSYLSDAPETCVNCHVMRPSYASWQRSSHAGVATCNDCHVPQQTPFHAYAFKARDGLYHAAVFTARLEPQVIRLSSGAIPVVEQNCRRCHERTISDVSLCKYQEGDLRCWDCHREVPHGRARSLSATPREIVPELPPVLERQTPRIGGREPRKNETPTHE